MALSALPCLDRAAPLGHGYGWQLELLSPQSLLPDCWAAMWLCLTGDPLQVSSPGVLCTSLCPAAGSGRAAAGSTDISVLPAVTPCPIHGGSAPFMVAVPHPWLVAVSHPCWQCPIHSESAPSMLRMSHPRWQCPIHGGSAPWLCEGQLCSSCDFSAFPRAGASTGAVLCRASLGCSV